MDQLKALQQSGSISRYTLIAYNNTSIMFHTSVPGEMHFVGIGMGIEPDRYPLAGSLIIGERDSGSFSEAEFSLPALLKQVGDVVITRDIAVEYNLNVGDTIILTDLRFGIPMESIVRGIAHDTPNHQGDKIYYTIGTEQKLADGQPVVNTIIANTAQAGTVISTLESSGRSVDWVAGWRDAKTANLWVIGLWGAGPEEKEAEILSVKTHPIVFVITGFVCILFGIIEVLPHCNEVEWC